MIPLVKALKTNSMYPENIPASDIYAEVPFYGRYFPKADDFQVDPQHINSQSIESLQYWASVVDLYNELVRIYPAEEGGRDVFTLGSVIVKSSHLHKTKNGRHYKINYSYADANEVKAVALAKSVLKDFKVPEIYFADKPYLSQGQKQSFQKQAQEILRQLYTVKPSDRRRARCHIVQDPNILTNSRVRPLEAGILFSDTNVDPDISFMHNNFTKSNCIVDNNKIVGLVDWEMAGFFGWKTAGEVHRRIRTPQREHFANTNLTEETLQDIMC
ncbi:putative phd transcription factor protein [Phaeoacremonium minimum UCRPA7]|uniref:Putative phd transcription factor protein n=1 Tax=Phaeoacremonium minimum (strain UCR-PA7) TaxID=1286976 RepID=R8BW81_PHAM7|nr:putative phd transcription factor protein [Phaeoacremonium minimum UCRPA7]EOO03585.1 putative phd transcription factor protein [Phaeoacremonium minimum UCRPA7]